MKYNDLIPELVVSNINISRDFYVNMLGFKVEYEREEDKFIFLSLGNIQLMLEEGSEEELSQMEKNLLKRDIEIREFRVNDEIIYTKEFSIVDPDGYFIRISE